MVAGLSAALVLGTGASGSIGDDDDRMRWDLVNINFTTGTVSAGGVASARASDGSKITLTGSGRFNPQSAVGRWAGGGGTWTTFSAAGAVTGSGTYRVTDFVTFAPAPGTLPVPNDAIGSPADARAGLLTVAVRYSGGERGVLTISCHLVGTPDTLFEGITTTKGAAAYWNPEVPPAPPGNGNRTLFHVLDDDDDDDVRATVISAITHGPTAPGRDVDRKVRQLDAAPGGTRQLNR
ncbi:MAG: hypothetical protein ACRDV2_01400, partial [Actinomycetes bacterium]